MTQTHIPTPKVISVAARSLLVSWTYADDDSSDEEGHSEQPVYHFQLSRAEADDPDHTVVYEGADTTVEVQDLKPETRYKLKLRVRERDDEWGDWSREYVEIEARTTDESLSQRLTNRLFRAVANRDSDTVKRILYEHAKEVGLETRDRHGKTLLMNACQSGCPKELIQALIKGGASTAGGSRSGKTPLSYAVTHGNLEAVQAILSHSHETLDTPDQGGSTPLMWAAENATPKNANGVAIVQCLLDSGADVNIEDLRQHTALDRLCATSGNLEAARALLDSGARITEDVNKAKGHHMTTLMTAALNGHYEVCVELMEKWNVDPSVETEFGGTARSFAQQAGHRRVVEAIDAKLHQKAHYDSLSSIPLQKSSP
ncbi:ankyrin repeat-containing domain protein [Gaertneriomyces semiglobifer]|nr:ankyrin repeat-containing domain protein [Gaertneriomyces semiglobifer]